MRILLVEDEKRLSEALVKLLKKEHCEVDPVYSGTDGLDYALTDSYDAIILDVMLPGLGTDLRCCGGCGRKRSPCRC